jgi:hypothetical protein
MARAWRPQLSAKVVTVTPPNEPAAFTPKSKQLTMTRWNKQLQEFKNSR